MEKIANNDIAILMATYNGEKYLSEQIDSILAQTCLDWHLYFHDDGSKDNTVAIIKDYIRRYPQKMTLLDYPSQGGACRNFLSMLERIEAPYYMFCDQDDVWLTDKIDLSIKTMQNNEKTAPNTPIIVFSDLIVTDSSLNTIAFSFHKYAGIYPQYIQSFNDLAATVLTPGCSMLINACSKYCIKYPATKATMHDAWIVACVASKCGKIVYIARPLLLYRQHSQNTLGARDFKQVTLWYRLSHLYNIIKSNYAHFMMLRDIGYGSIIKYIKYRIIYKKNIANHNKNNAFSV